MESYQVLRSRARTMVNAESITEHYEDEKIKDLLYKKGHLYWWSGKRIPEYFEEYHYWKYDLDDWIEHMRVKKTLGSMQDAIDTNLAKYQLEMYSPLVDKVDDRYADLKEKSPEVVDRFFQMNKRMRERNDFCNRLFGTKKADVNYHACLRVFAERKSGDDV